MKTSTKIIELKQDVSQHLFNCNKVFVGFAGNASTWSTAIGWLLVPEGKPPRINSGLEMMALTDDKQILHATSLTSWLALKDKHYSIGSGMPFALSAMDMGKTPKEAVAFASKRDVYTGLGIKEFIM